MGFLGISSYILLPLTVIIICFACLNLKNVIKQDKIKIPVYVFLLGILPLLSFLLMYIILTNSSLDFFGYILVILFTCCVFISVWIYTTLNGEYKVVELSMYIVVGTITLIFMMLMGLIEVLPNNILEFYLRSLISKANEYDIWSRPPYQLAHFLTYIFSFPYMASFIICRVILSFRKNKELISAEL